MSRTRPKTFYPSLASVLKLIIRLNPHMLTTNIKPTRYPHSKLLEINSHSLFSRWFSESGKLVQRLFSNIMELVEDDDTFVVVLIGVSLFSLVRLIILLLSYVK